MGNKSNKVKVYELAKELNTTSKSLLDKIVAIGINVKSHMSPLEDDQLEKIYDYFGMKRKTDDDTKNIEKPKNEEVKAKVEESPKEPQARPRHSGPRIVRTAVREIRIDEKTGIATEFVTEIKGDKRRHTTNVIEVPKYEKSKQEIFESMNPRKKTVEKKVDSEKKKEEVKTTEPIKEEKKQESSKENTREIKQDIIKDVKTEEKKVEQPETIKERKTEDKDVKTDKVENAIPNETKKEIKSENTQKEEKTKVETSKQTTTQKPEQQQRRQYDDKKQGQFNNRRDDFRNGNRQNRPFNKDGFKKDNGYNKDGYKKEGFNKGNTPKDGYNKDGYKKDFNKDNRNKKTDFRKDKDMPLASEEFIAKTPSRKGTANKEFDKQKAQEKEQKAFNRTRNVQQSTKSRYDRYKDFEHSRVSDLLDNDAVLDVNDNNYRRKNNNNNKKKQFAPKVQRQEPVKVVLKVTIPDIISVKSLAERMKKQASEIIKKLFGYGIIATLNQEIDYDTAAVVATDMGYTVEKEVVVNEEDILFDDTEDKAEELETRAPVVVVMGHVDHGKTSLLDAIRSTNIIDKEFGGITQHIGAYNVTINNRKITFLDTPGHEAFTAMRARGAQVTDIAILVVAADDGVKPQTIEAINHAKAANLSIIVALNKIDKPEANPDRVKQQLMDYGLVAEEWGGDTIFVPVSAKKREGINQLLEIVLLVADMLDLKANPNKQPKGTVIESKLDKGKGPVATVLVQRGTLKTGDVIVTGTIMGKVRAMTNDKMQKIKKAGPSTPVEIIGFPEVPEAGEIFYVVKDEKTAKHLVEKRKIKQREIAIHRNRVTLDDLFEQIKEGEVKELNIIVKADVQGSVEAIRQSLEKLSNSEVKVKTIHGGVGSINESDVMLAAVSNAIVIGFNVKEELSAKTIAERDNVDVRLYSIIYEAIDAVTAAIKGLQAPKYHEVIYGHAEVRQIFKISGNSIAGAYVNDGKILRNANVRVLRDNKVIHTGKIDQLKRFKDDVKEVSTTYECGISIEGFNDIVEGDIIESFGQEEDKE